MIVIAIVLTIVSKSVSAGEATLTAVGDLDRLSIGQLGYCGERVEADSQSWRRIVLKGEGQVWIFASSRYRLPGRDRICRIERTFIPASGAAYILRVTHSPGDCNVELFRAASGADPVRERLMKPEAQVCALQ